ncbi:periodic tryptophan protein [Thraustotheca clavata]|uniref:Periodic tryptophan protein n=1 Tax=Thraustotheca clavata TaxID=74557 RepID=A0A1V9Z8H3_9STRA|nr:periodic tryptophan protein [Thraustotheca clavata]
MISALGWIPRGAAKRTPEKFVLSAEEVAMMTQLAADEDEEAEEIEEDEEMEVIDEEMDAEEDNSTLPDSFKMDEYDEEDNDVAVKEFLGGKGDAGAGDDDDIEEEQEDIDDGLDDDEDAEDMEIRPTDAVVIVATTEEDYSNLEIQVYEEDTGNLYVHHEINLPAFPLCLSWMDMAPTLAENGNPVNGSFVAVGTFKPGIEIWNLDVLDVLEPAATLGGEENSSLRDVAVPKSMRKKHKKAQLKPGSHQDAVLGLDWNTGHRNMIASASADATVKIWDITTQQCMHTMSHHTDKVQSVRWNPVEATVLASASFDRSLLVLDGRNPNAYSKFSLSADVESMQWHPHTPSVLVASTEDGVVVAYDVRMNNSTPLFRFQAHQAAVSAISFSPLMPGLFATASTDKHVKIWDLANNKPVCVASKDMNIGELMTLSFYKDSPFLLAAGGSGGILALWDTSENDAVERKFTSRMANHAQGIIAPVENNLNLQFKSADDIGNELIREEEEAKAKKQQMNKQKKKGNKK